ncbi:hypothetical protein R3P38DRAFT_2805777 [Favolaschia claudopus]|uniref:Uncharacterized protein n=1 Tax=Favolaschia claudopus TaxID=2862362 RepID=A0AAV9ZMF8_9AGAR
MTQDSRYQLVMDTRGVGEGSGAIGAALRPEEFRRAVDPAGSPEDLLNRIALEGRGKAIKALYLTLFRFNSFNTFLFILDSHEMHISTMCASSVRCTFRLHRLTSVSSWASLDCWAGPVEIESDLSTVNVQSITSGSIVEILTIFIVLFYLSLQWDTTLLWIDFGVGAVSGILESLESTCILNAGLDSLSFVEFVPTFESCARSFRVAVKLILSWTWYGFARDRNYAGISQGDQDSEGRNYASFAPASCFVELNAKTMTRPNLYWFESRASVRRYIDTMPTPKPCRSAPNSPCTPKLCRFRLRHGLNRAPAHLTQPEVYHRDVV